MVMPVKSVTAAQPQKDESPILGHMKQKYGRHNKGANSIKQLINLTNFLNFNSARGLHPHAPPTAKDQSRREPHEHRVPPQDIQHQQSHRDNVKGQTTETSTGNKKQAVRAARTLEKFPIIRQEGGGGAGAQCKGRQAWGPQPDCCSKAAASGKKV